MRTDSIEDATMNIDIFLYLKNNPNSDANEIAKVLKLDPSNLRKLLNRRELGGWVDKKRVDPTFGGPKFKFSITEKCNHFLLSLQEKLNHQL